LHSGKELCALRNKLNGNSEQRKHKAEGSMHRMLAEDHTQGTNEHHD
jgi:hypothetical protein